MRQGHSTSVFVGAPVPWRASFLAGIGLEWVIGSWRRNGGWPGQHTCHQSRPLLTELLLEEADEDRRHATDWQRPVKPHRQSVIPWYCIWFVQIREPVNMDSFFCLSLCIAYLDLWDPERDREGEAEEERDLECELEPDKLLTLTLPITVCLPEKTSRKRETETMKCWLYVCRWN